MGLAHAWALRPREGERGQGTVEYVGLILLIAAVIGAVVLASSKIKDGGIAQAIVGKLKDAIEGVKAPGKG
jgi:hypothetical protein